MQVRPYQPTDCDAVLQAWHAASMVATPFLPESFLAQERIDIQQVYLRVAQTWVVEVEDTVVGFISLIENEVGGFFVHPDHQGLGCGRALMDHARKQHSTLVLDVFEENEVGRRFYAAYGFEIQSKSLHEPSGHMQLRLILP